jgi:hypothetical protein
MIGRKSAVGVSARAGLTLMLLSVSVARSLASGLLAPAGAKVGIHSARFDAQLRRQAIQNSPDLAGITMSDIHQGFEQYFALMGLDARLPQMASRVSPRRMYVLGPDEIRRFGIETAEFYETPWASLTDRAKQAFAIKSVTRAMESDGKEHRTVSVQFRCVRGRLWLVYQRELPPNEVGYAAQVRVVAGENGLGLHRGPKKQASEIWGAPLSTPFLQAARTTPNLVFTEDVIPSGHSQVWSREIKFSSAGLSNLIDGVVKGCDSARPPEETKGAGAR